MVENCGHLRQHGNLISSANSKSVQRASPFGEPKGLAEVFVVKNLDLDSVDASLEANRGFIPTAVDRTVWREVINDVALHAALPVQE